MLHLTSSFEGRLFPETMASDLFNSSASLIDPIATIVNQHNFNVKPADIVTDPSLSSLNFVNTSLNLGLSETNSLSSQPDPNVKTQRDELTGMDLEAPERSVSQAASRIPTEEWNFELRNYPIVHQGLKTLNVKVDYELQPGLTAGQYPDFIPIQKSIDNFLVNYPNETDFWEIVNKNLTEKVLADNPVLKDVKIRMEVAPTRQEPYPYASTVFRARNGQPEENLGFLLPNYAVEHQGRNQAVNVDIDYKYKPGITPAEYPNFVPIAQSVERFLTNYPNETDFWEIVNKNLAQNILNQNPSLAGVNINLNVLPTTEIPYSYTSRVSRNRVSNSAGTSLNSNNAQLTEKFGFSVKNYPVIHQGLNNLDIDVNYKYREGIQNSQYPNFIPIAQSLNNFLVNYPNETDFWEIVNKNLTERLLAENPQISSLTVGLNVLPTDKQAALYSSTVTRTADRKLGEGWQFKLENYPIEHQGFNTINVDVKYQYKQGIANNQYPNYLPIYNSIEKFLMDYPNETDFWEIVNKNLTQKVLSENPALDSLQINIQVLPRNTVPVPYASTVSIG